MANGLFILTVEKEFILEVKLADDGAPRTLCMLQRILQNEWKPHYIPVMRNFFEESGHE